MVRLRPIENDEAFERLCCDVAKEVFGDFAAHRYGRKGQEQGGIDIRATNRRGLGESIVIQCKYKAQPEKRHGAILRAELETEFSSALSNHKFDEFILASTSRTDAKLQDAADSLASMSGKRVHVWSLDDIEAWVDTHPRLQRLYAQGHASYGVELIDADFLDGIGQAVVDPFAFYCGLSADFHQWTGVLNCLDARRDCQVAVDRQIDELFEKASLTNRIATVVCGDGGSGKSTVLRRIAVDRARSGGCVCWWVESLEQFLAYDAITIGDSQHLRHLVIVEDWYRNVRNDDPGDFYVWLRSKRNVLVLIGDRVPTGRSYLHHLYGGVGAMHRLSAAENSAVLQHVAKVLEPFADATEFLQGHAELLRHAPLFMVLFILGHAMQNADKRLTIDLSAGVEGAFQAIVAKRLIELERSDAYRGFGKAVCRLAKFYAAEESPWRHFGEEFLVQTARYFAPKSPGHTARALSVPYPPSLSALMHREVISGPIVWCRFNHDIIAERGAANSGIYAAELNLRLDEDDSQLHELLDLLVQ